MKRLFILALVAGPFSSKAQDLPFSVSGEIKQAGPHAKVYLNYTKAGQSLMDSALVVNGKFQFRGTVSGPTQGMLALDHQGVGLTAMLQLKYDAMELYLDEGQVSVQTTDSLANARVEGSKINTDKAEYNAVLVKQVGVINGIAEEYSRASEAQHKDSVFEKAIKARYEKAVDEKLALMHSYINAHPDSYFSLLALAEIAGKDIDVDKTAPVYAKLSAHIQNSEFGKYFANLMTVAKLTTIGAPAPLFTQNDADDKPVSLASFRGKYVLVDFWASWCGPCRAENPTIVKVYDKYKNKNFTILGVSLDQPGKRAEWLAAVKADGLGWTQVADLNTAPNPVATQYGVTAIPQNYLIDPSGKIIAKNLRGEELGKKLAELFN